jgi:hypothetical protein
MAWIKRDEALIVQGKKKVLRKMRVPAGFAPDK